MKKSKSPAPGAPKSLTPEEVAKRDASALARIAEMDDVDKLRNLMANAERMNVLNVREAAFRRLADVQVDTAENAPGTVEHDFWLTIHAYEELLKQERGKTIRLTPTRQKIVRNGAVKTLAGFADATKDSPAFGMLMARGLPDMTGEAVILRHPDDFDAETRDAASARLTEAGVDPATLAA